MPFFSRRLRPTSAQPATRRHSPKNLASEGERLAQYLGALLLIWVACSFVLAPSSPFMLAYLTDPDDYLRLTQVQDYLLGLDWFPRQPRLDPDFPYVTEWSRLPDWPLIAVAASWRLLGFDPMTALFLAAFFVPLVLLALLLPLLMAFTRRLAGRRYAWVVLVLLAASAMALRNFTPMRVDHHGYQMFLGLLSVAALLWSLWQPTTLKLWQKWAGPLVAAFATWLGLLIGAEGWLVPLLLVGALGLLSLFWPRLALPLLARYALCVAILMAGTLAQAALAVGDWPQLPFNLTQPNWLHLAFWGGLAVVASLSAFSLRYGSLLPRLLWLVGSVGVVALLWLLFPGLGSGLYNTMDAFSANLILSNVSEAKSFGRYLADILTRDGFGLRQLVQMLSNVGQVLALPLLAVLVAGSLAWRARGAKGAQRRVGWLLLGLVQLGLVLLLLLWQFRVGTHANLLALPLIAAGIARVWRWLALRALRAPHQPSAQRRRLAAEFWLLFALGPLLYPIIPSLLAAKPVVPDMLLHPAARFSPKCTDPQIWHILNNDKFFDRQPRRILAAMELGPEILFRTQHLVLSAPYTVPHGNRAMVEIFTDTNLARATQRLRDLHIDAILVCTQVPYYLWPQGEAKAYEEQMRRMLAMAGQIDPKLQDGRTLMARLVTGDVPASFVPQTTFLPSELKLYRLEWGKTPNTSPPAVSADDGLKEPAPPR